MEIRKMRLKDLKHAPYNPRRISPTMMERLKQSLSTFGYVEPIVWNQRTGHIVGGHQRVKALLQLGVEEAEVVVVDLPPEEEKALNIALNKISGDWDYEKLVEVLQEVKSKGLELELTGFTEDDLNDLLEEVAFRDIDQYDDGWMPPEKQETPISRLGDLWLIGEHKLYCGVLSPETAELLLGDYTPDMVITRLPLPEDGGLAGLTMIAETLWQTREIFLCRAEQYITHIPNRKKGSWLVWDKGPTDTHELIFSKVRHKRALIRQEADPTEDALTIGVVLWLYDKFGYRGDAVVDPFAHTGAVLIASEQTGRTAYLWERDPTYCDYIIRRWIDLTGATDEVRLNRQGRIYAYEEVRSQ